MKKYLLAIIVIVAAIAVALFATGVLAGISWNPNTGTNYTGIVCADGAAAFDGNWSSNATIVPDGGVPCTFYENWTRYSNATANFTWAADAASESPDPTGNTPTNITCYNSSSQWTSITYDANSNEDTIDCPMWNCTRALPSSCMQNTSIMLRWTMYNVNSIFTEGRLEITDAPVEQNFTISVPPGSTFQAGNKTYFNITWESTNGMDNSNVFVEGNWSGVAKNYSMTNTTPNTIYTYSEVLPSGKFYWKSWARDQRGIWSVTNTTQFTIAPASLSPSIETSPDTPIPIRNGTATLTFCARAFEHTGSELVISYFNGATGNAYSPQSAKGIWNTTWQYGLPQYRLDLSNSTQLAEFTKIYYPGTSALQTNYIDDGATRVDIIDTLNDTESSRVIMIGYDSLGVYTRFEDYDTNEWLNLMSNGTMNLNEYMITKTSNYTRPRLYRNSSDIDAAENSKLVELDSGRWKYVCNWSLASNFTGNSTISYIVAPLSNITDYDRDYNAVAARGWQGFNASVNNNFTAIMNVTMILYGNGMTQDTVNLTLMQGTLNDGNWTLYYQPSFCGSSYYISVVAVTDSYGFTTYIYPAESSTRFAVSCTEYVGSTSAPAAGGGAPLLGKLPAISGCDLKFVPPIQSDFFAAGKSFSKTYTIKNSGNVTCKGDYYVASPDEIHGMLALDHTAFELAPGQYDLLNITATLPADAEEKVYEWQIIAAVGDYEGGSALFSIQPSLVKFLSQENVFVPVVGIGLLLIIIFAVALHGRPKRYG